MATTARRFVKEKTVGNWRNTEVLGRMTPNTVVSRPSHQPPWVPSHALISHLPYHLFSVTASYPFSIPVPFLLPRR